MQGSVQAACIRNYETGNADVVQQALCQAYPYECSTAEATDYCSAGPAVTEQPSSLPGVSQLSKHYISYNRRYLRANLASQSLRCADNSNIYFLPMYMLTCGRLVLLLK